MSAPGRSVRRLLLATMLGLGAASAGMAALADPPKAGHAPDPPAKPSRKQWVFDIKVVEGRPRVNGVTAVRLKSPTGTARVMGRYALELYVGRELLDRIRFNVPLTGDGPTPKEDKRPFKRPTFDKVNVQIRVRMADNPRATYALLVDRATGKTEKLAWPPGSDAPAKKPAPKKPAPEKPAPETPKSPADAGAPEPSDGGASRPRAPKDEAPPGKDAGAPSSPPDAAPPNDDVYP